MARNCEGGELKTISTQIIRTVLPEHFKQIFELLPNIKNLSYSVRDLKVWWIKNFNERTFRVWVETDDEEKIIQSFMIAQIVKPLLEDEVFIMLTYIDPHSDKGQEFMSGVEGWARTLGVKRISAYVNREALGFCHKYNFTEGNREIFKILEY